MGVHKSDTFGIGYDRTKETNSGYAALYAPELASIYEKPETTPE